MSIIVNTNVQSLIAQKNLSYATKKLNTSTERLSTGFRINHAVEDAAGLFIATELKAQLSGSEQCQTNISLGINVLQIAEGDLSTIQDNVMRIKDLTTQAAGGIYATSSRDAIALEITARVNEIDRIARASKFNGLNLLDGSAPMATTGFRIQVGAGSNPSANSITIDASIFAAATHAGIRLDWTVSTGAHISLGSKIATATSAAAYIAVCENALNNIATRRTAIGVAQSRLEMSAEGLSTSIENLAAANSTIMDTDMASEVSRYTNAQILQQITTSLLTQTNQAPSVALSLLQ